MAASSAVAAPAVAFAAVAKAAAIAEFTKSIATPMVSIGASKSSGNGARPLRSLQARLAVGGPLLPSLRFLPL